MEQPFGKAGFGPASVLLNAQKTAARDLQNANIEPTKKHRGRPRKKPVEDTAAEKTTQVEEAAAPAVTPAEVREADVVMPAPVDQADTSIKADEKKPDVPEELKLDLTPAEDDVEEEQKKPAPAAAAKPAKAAKAHKEPRTTSKRHAEAAVPMDIYFQNEKGKTVAYSTLVKKIEAITGQPQTEARIYVKPLEGRVYYVSGDLIGSISIFED